MKCGYLMRQVLRHVTHQSEGLIDRKNKDLSSGKHEYFSQDEQKAGQVLHTQMSLAF